MNLVFLCLDFCFCNMIPTHSHLLLPKSQSASLSHLQSLSGSPLPTVYLIMRCLLYLDLPFQIQFLLLFETFPTLSHMEVIQNSVCACYIPACIIFVQVISELKGSSSVFPSWQNPAYPYLLLTLLQSVLYRHKGWVLFHKQICT